MLCYYKVIIVRKADFHNQLLTLSALNWAHKNVNNILGNFEQYLDNAFRMMNIFGKVSIQFSAFEISSGAMYSLNRTKLFKFSVLFQSALFEIYR